MRHDLECSYLYTGRGLAGEKRMQCSKGESERDESTEEQLQCNEQYKYTPHDTLSPLSPAMAIHKTTETRIHV